MTTITINLDTETASATDAAALRALADVFDPPKAEEKATDRPEFYFVRDEDGDLGVARVGDAARYFWCSNEAVTRTTLADLRSGAMAWGDQTAGGRGSYMKASVLTPLEGDA